MEEAEIRKLQAQIGLPESPGRSEALALLVKVALQGISVEKLCKHPHYVNYNITPQEVEEQIKRQGDIIPKEPVHVTLNRKVWYHLWPVELAKLLGLIAVEFLIFPHLAGISFDATLGNILALTMAIYFVRFVFICLSTCVFIPALLFAVSKGWDAEKLTELLGGSSQRKFIYQCIDVIFALGYPALTIVLINKFNPSLLSISLWYGPLLGASSIYILWRIISACICPFTKHKEISVSDSNSKSN